MGPFILAPEGRRLEVALEDFSLQDVGDATIELRGGGVLASNMEAARQVVCLAQGRRVGALDVWSADGRRFGFAGLLPLVGLPRALDIELHLSIDLVSGDSISSHIGDLVGSRRWVTCAYEPELLPLLVVSFGRSGSTLMMSKLSQFSDVIVPDMYPYEVREAAYFSRAFALLSSPANHGWGCTPEDVASPGSLFQLGPDPHFHHRSWREIYDDGLRRELATERPRHAKEFALRMTDRFYGHVSKSAGKKPRFFAEKANAGALPDLFDEIYTGQARCLFLIRDFRDMLCSIRAFNRKRGRRDWGEGDDIDVWMRQIRTGIGQLKESHHRRPLSLTVKYEDLVSDPKGTILDVGSWLGASAPADQEIPRELSAMEATHATTTSGGSVGRWKADLDEETAEKANIHLGEYLDYFGYPV